MHLAKIAQNQSGNIAMLTALCAIPVFGVIAFSVDYSRAQNQRVELQYAIDNAALAIARLPNPDQAEMDALVAQTLAANLHNPDALAGVTTTVSRVDQDVTVRASYTSPSYLSVNDFDIVVEAVSTRDRALDRPLEFVMIMDTTRSMDIVSHSWADAVDTINWVFGELTYGVNGVNTVDISFLPISDRVNIGTANSSWLNAAAPTGWNGCVEPRYTPTTAAVAAGVTTSSDEPGADYHLSIDTPTEFAFEASIPGVTGGLSDFGSSYPYCPNTITGPTSHLPTLTSAVNGSTAAGTGRFDLALTWGWRLVAEEWSGVWNGDVGYPAPAGSADKIITIVTDSHTVAWDYEAGGSGGARPGGHARNTVSDDGFVQIEALCEAIKDDGVTVAVLLTNSYSRAKSPWTNCASEDWFFEIDTIEDFKVAMGAIATRFANIRLKS